MARDITLLIFLDKIFSHTLTLNRPLSTATEEKPPETAKGTPEKKEFQAETRMLLDIVARSLYSDKEVSV